MTQQSYRINLEIFEGPMDLLLYLIKKNDLNIYDIPIAFITDEYLKYINALKELNIDFASDFLVTAAELAHIKSKMLLPADGTIVEEEELDPRADLVHRLIEYQRYKEGAEKLARRSMLFRDVFIHSSKELSDIPREESITLDGNAFQLLEAFNKILEKIPKGAIKQTVIDRISVNERILQMVEMIKFGQTVPLVDLLLKEKLTRHYVVTTFLALLEMIRLKMVKIYQGGRFEIIYITGTMKEADPVDETIKMMSEEESHGTATTESNS